MKLTVKEAFTDGGGISLGYGILRDNADVAHVWIREDAYLFKYAPELMAICKKILLYETQSQVELESMTGGKVQPQPWYHELGLLVSSVEHMVDV